MTLTPESPARDALTPKEIEAKHNKILITCSINGTQYYNGITIAGQLLPKVPLYLRREPTNQYDPFAIEVIGPDRMTKLGYVPGKVSQIFATLLDNGIDVRAVVAVSEVVKDKLSTYMHLILGV